MPPEIGSALTLRDQLLSRAQLGEIAPDEAETEALFEGCGPLAIAPESLDLDPRTEPNWTLIMTLVWIVTRDLSAVRAVWAKARRHSTHWVSFPLGKTDSAATEDKLGWELRRIDPATVSDVRAIIEEGDLSLDPPIVVLGWEAQEELWGNLCSGRLCASGKRYGAAGQLNIPTAEWNDLEWLNDPSVSADTVGGRADNLLRYSDIGVSGQRVRELWPSLDQIQSEEFEREDWTVFHAILWITYRDPSLFHFVGSSSPRARAQCAMRPTRVQRPRKELLAALQTGKLNAIRRGENIAREYWFGRQLPRLQPDETRIYFWRRDLFEGWPPFADDLKQRITTLLAQLRCEKGSRPSQKDAYDFIRGQKGCEGVTIRQVRESMREYWGPGKQGKRAPDPQ